MNDAALVRARHVYVHVPFCARRCSYCDFSIAIRRDVPVTEFLDALAAELRARTNASLMPQEIDTLYFGGGTPSHLGADGVAKLMRLMSEWFILAPGAEVTLEANPDDVTRESTRAWHAAGITRVSLGAQSFEPHILEWMHRTHSASQIEIAVELLRDTPFASWSFDLIFALPSSLSRDWARDLSRALEMRPPHLSLYGLTVEPGTALDRWSQRGEVEATDESSYEMEFLSADAGARAAGFDHYEVSNFAQPGHHARHNRSYWSGAPYLGFGPSAHGFDGNTRRWNRAAYAAWRDAATTGADPIAGSELIGTDETSIESVYLGLRTTQGLLLSTPAQVETVRPWLEAGWGVLRDNRLTLSPLGWLRLDGLAATLTRARELK
jgi:oxygen-independent coproporphyrinogen III oxidase